MRPVYLLGLLPFLGFFVGIFFANRVEPYVLGLPFVMFWIAMWVVLTSVIMGIIYKLDPINREGDTE
jgi:hypothetical protein